MTELRFKVSYVHALSSISCCRQDAHNGLRISGEGWDDTCGQRRRPVQVSGPSTKPPLARHDVLSACSRQTPQWVAESQKWDSALEEQMVYWAGRHTGKELQPTTSPQELGEHQK